MAGHSAFRRPSILEIVPPPLKFVEKVPSLSGVSLSSGFVIAADIAFAAVVIAVPSFFGWQFSSRNIHEPSVSGWSLDAIKHNILDST